MYCEAKTEGELRRSHFSCICLCLFLTRSSVNAEMLAADRTIVLQSIKRDENGKILAPRKPMTRDGLKVLYGKELTAREMIERFRDGRIKDLNLTLLVLEYKVSVLPLSTLLF